MSPATPASRAARAVDLGALAVVAGLGALHLADGFTGDQALGLVAARILRGGGVMYRDFWDGRQPGIYWLYTGASALFGYSEVAVHTAELLAWLVVSALLIVAFRRRVAHRWAASALPVLLVGVYYATAHYWELTQPDILVAAPMLGAWLLADRAPPGRRAWVWYLAAGLCGGLVAVVKLVCLAVPLVLWVRMARDRGWRVLVPIALGGAAVVGAVIGYFAATGILGRVVWTTFTWGPQTNALASPPVSRFVHGLEWAGSSYAVLIVLAAVALAFGRSRAPGAMATERGPQGARQGAPRVAKRCRRATPDARPDRTVLDAVLWLVVAFAILLPQQWWEYQFQSLIPPLAVLAMVGLDRLPHLVHRIPASRRAAAGVGAGLIVIAAAAVPIGRSAYQVRRVQRHGWLRTVADRRALREELEPDYVLARVDGSFLHDAHACAGPIYVFGDPIMYLVTGRGQAIAFNGWGPEIATGRQWRDTDAELRSHPPAYLYVEDDYRAPVKDRSPVTWALLHSEFRPWVRSPNGEWFVPRAEEAASCTRAARPPRR